MSSQKSRADAEETPKKDVTEKTNHNCTGKAEGDGRQGRGDHSRGNLAKPEDCLPRSLITAEAAGQEPELRSPKGRPSTSPAQPRGPQRHMPAYQGQPLAESAEQVTADKGLQSELNVNGKTSREHTFKHSLVPCTEALRAQTAPKWVRGTKDLQQ